VNAPELTPRQIGARRELATNLAQAIDDLLKAERDRTRRIELIAVHIGRAIMLGERHGREQALAWRKRQ
jgi:hypothetical protein